MVPGEVETSGRCPPSSSQRGETDKRDRESETNFLRVRGRQEQRAKQPSMAQTGRLRRYMLP